MVQASGEAALPEQWREAAETRGGQGAGGPKLHSLVAN